MCLVIGPAALAGIQTALSIGGAGLGLLQQVQTAQASNEFYEQNAEAANKAAADRYSHLQTRALQEKAAASNKLFENRIAALKARSTARVQAGEAGVSGLSVDQLIGDYYASEGWRSDAIAANYQMDYNYILGELDATEAQAQGRINNAPRASVGALDVLGAGLKAATGAMGAATTYSRSTRGNNAIDYTSYGLDIA